MAQALKYPTTQNFVQKTLGATFLAGATVATLSDVNYIQNKPGVFIVDRVDANGNETPTAREVCTFTGTSGVTVTGVVKNADSSGTDQQHAVGAIVEFGPDTLWAQALIDGVSQVVDPTTGLLDTTKVVDLTSAQTLTNKTLTSPTTTGTDTGTATLTNKTLTSPIVAQLQGASSHTQFPAVIGEYNNGNSGATYTVDWSKGDRQLLTISAACTLSYSNAVAGQTLTLRLVENSTGGYAITLPTSKWPGGTAGTFTTTANAINLLIVYYDGTNYLTQLAAGFS